eukprot:m.237632 g.237632  ORF g.237632 m.237632 type:complete len:301 (-) comp13928_c1_seq6:60-962(-)
MVEDYFTLFNKEFSSFRNGAFFFFFFLMDSLERSRVDTLSVLRRRVVLLINEKTSLQTSDKSSVSAVVDADEMAALSMKRLRACAEETVTVCEGQKRKVAQAHLLMERLKILRAENDELRLGLAERIQSLEDDLQQRREGTNESQKKLLTVKAKQAVEVNKRIMDALRQFIRKYFPVPTAADTRKATGKQGQNRRKKKKTINDFFPQHIYSDDEDNEEDEDEDEGPIRTSATSRAKSSYVSLSVLLQDLMNGCVSSPQDPYVEIQHNKHWMPYVEMLLRAGIVVFHPQHPNKIKLCEFHI